MQWGVIACLTFSDLHDKNGAGVVHFNDEKLFAPMGHAFGVHG